MNPKNGLGTKVFFVLCFIVFAIAVHGCLSYVPPAPASIVVDQDAVLAITGSPVMHMSEQRGSFEQDCLLKMYQQGILAICTNLLVSEFSLQLYSYVDGTAVTDVVYVPATALGNYIPAPANRWYYLFTDRTEVDSWTIEKGFPGLTTQEVPDSTREATFESNAFVLGRYAISDSQDLFIFKNRGVYEWFVEPAYFVVMNDQNQVVTALAAKFHGLSYVKSSQVVGSTHYFSSGDGFVSYDSETGNLGWTEINLSEQLWLLNQKLPVTCSFELVGQFTISRNFMNNDSVSDFALEVVRLEDGRMIAFGKGTSENNVPLRVRPYTITVTEHELNGSYSPIISDRYYVVQTEVGSYLFSNSDTDNGLLPSQYMDSICNPAESLLVIHN